MATLQDWTHDEEFIVLDEKEIEMRKLMKQMQDMGMGGQMYNREDLAKMDPLAAQVRPCVSNNVQI